MKTFAKTIATSSLVLLLALYSILSLPLTQSRPVLLAKNANGIIEQTCKRTPYYHICISNLRSDPRSSGADLRGLAIIMAGVVGTKANETLSHINDLTKSRNKDDERKALSLCALYYDIGIVSTDAPIAIDALKAGDFQSAENFLNDAAKDAVACEKNFSGRKSPLTRMNKVVHDVAAVAAAITKLLL